MAKERASAEARQTIRTVRLDDEDLTALLDSLDEVESNNKDLRKNPRYCYRVRGAVVHMQQPGSGGTLQFQVPTRNLSATGLAFVHGGFIHPNTRCVAQLITAHGTWNNVAGHVVQCEYVENNIHAVTLQFDHDIDPAEYCADATQCRLLFAEDDPVMTKMTNFHLQQLGAIVDHVPNGLLAVEKALEGTYDALLLDMEMPELDGFGVLKELRGRGYTGLIVAATGMTGPEDKKRCIDAGADRYIPKPYSRDDLSNLVQSLYEEPLFSTMADQSQFAELIDNFVTEIPKQVRSLEQALFGKDTEALAQGLRQIKSQGTSFGFEVLSEHSAAIEKSLVSGQPITELQSKIRELIKLCLSVRGATKRPGRGS